ncbi:MAG: YgfZ/GcvT domain-containing protein [Candidatus Acidiferrales bacterium]
MSFETPLREQHENLHASLGNWLGCLLPSRFTDFAAEYEIAQKSVALLDTSYRAVLRFTGPDSVRYLNAILTADIKQLAPGTGTPALLLNPQGHILAELECYASEDEIIVFTHVSEREHTLAALDKYIIMDDVTMEDITSDFSTIAFEGPHAPELAHSLFQIKLPSMPEFAHALSNLGSIDLRLFRRSHFGAAGAEILVAREDLARLWTELFEAVSDAGGAPVGYEALNCLRLEAGIPWFGYDFDETVIPHEAALESTHVNFNKGCYTGQEIVERVRSRGHVNRRRVGLEFHGSTEPAHGVELFASGVSVGRVTSAAYSPAARAFIGMGYVRREQNSPGSEVEYPGGRARVIELPLRTKLA